MQLLGQTLLSRYRIERVLGSGGFGDTYLALDTALPKSPPCVVKHLQPKHESEQVKAIALSLFEREANTLYELGENDSIPRLFAHFEQNGEFFLVQEFIDGHDLSEELIPGKPWNNDQVYQLLNELLGILAILHKKQVIHRDVKPQNIMRRNQDGKLFLIDFGAVKEIPQLTITETGQTALTVAIGSPGYMPSEQAVGKPRASSDLYAVGIIAIQALTGQYPQEFPTDPQTGELIWKSKESIPMDLDSFIRKLTQDHFSQRHQDAVEASSIFATLLKPQPSTTVQNSHQSNLNNLVNPTQNSIPPTEFQVPIQTNKTPISNKKTSVIPWVISGVSLLALAIGALIVIAPWEGSVTISKEGETSNTNQKSNVNINIQRSNGTSLPSSDSLEVQPLVPQKQVSPSANPSNIASPEETAGFSSEASTSIQSQSSSSNISKSGYAFVIDPPSNVRVTPNGEIQCAVPQPQVISVGARSGDWYQTFFCNTPGYIHSSQLSFEQLKALVIDPPSNVRASPNGDILCAVTQKDVIETFGDKSGWYRTNVCNSNSIGYIHHSQILLDP